MNKRNYEGINILHIGNYKLFPYDPTFDIIQKQYNDLYIFVRNYSAFGRKFNILHKVHHFVEELYIQILSSNSESLHNSVPVAESLLGTTLINEQHHGLASVRLIKQLGISRNDKGIPFKWMNQINEIDLKITN